MMQHIPADTGVWGSDWPKNSLAGSGPSRQNRPLRWVRPAAETHWTRFASPAGSTDPCLPVPLPELPPMLHATSLRRPMTWHWMMTSGAAQPPTRHDPDSAPFIDEYLIQPPLLFRIQTLTSP